MLRCGSSSPEGNRRWRCGAPLLALFILLVCAISPPQLQAVPFVPESSSTALLKRHYPVPVSTGVADQLATPAERVKRARAYVQYAMESKDPSFYSSARKLLAPWWDLGEVDPEIRLLRAMIKQHQHRFDEALADLTILLQHNNRHVQARISRAAVFLAAGNVRASRRDCEALALQADPVLVINCLAQSLGLMGNAAPLEKSLQQLLSRASVQGTSQYWELLTTLSELYLIQGKVGEAEQALLQLLQHQPDSRYAQEQIIHLLHAGERYVELYKFTATGNSFLMKLYRAVALTRSGRQQDGEYQALLEDIRQDKQLLEQAPPREAAKSLAQYYFFIEQDPVKAQVYAERNWRTQKTVIDALILLRIAAVDSVDSVKAWKSAAAIQDVRLDRALRAAGV